MDKLEVSLNNTIEYPEVFHRMIAEFERQSRLQVELQTYDWDSAWMEFIRISLYRYGPSISETGDTWMGSLASRNCLRTFKKDEIASIGGETAFLGEMWKSCRDFEDGSIVAIPWSLDTYLAYYRRDMLAKAGVDEKTAFSSLEAFDSTLERLQAAGVEIPLAIATGDNSANILHNAASWVWAMGGDLISADGKRALFTEAKTLAGLRKYFGLHRFLPRSARELDDSNLEAMFVGRDAAIILENPPLLYDLKHETMPVSVVRNIGVAVQPGVPVVGGSNLIIWSHVPVRQEKAAVEFVRTLTTPENMLKLFESSGLLPARLEALNQVEADPVYAVVAQSLKSGRAFRHLRLWGLVEEKLTKALARIWKTIFAFPQPDIDQIIQDNLGPLEERLNTILSE